MHYATPSSLPSDYAILSRYAAANNLDHAPIDPNTQNEEPSDDDDTLSVNSLPVPGCTHSPRRTSFPTPYVTPFNPTLGPLPDKSGFRSGPHHLNANENTPLLSPFVPRIPEDVDEEASESEPASNLLWDETRILAKYTLPVFGTHVLEYSLVIASIVSIGHLSTTALAASTLGSMTASVTGYSIIQGFTSTLDTMLPSAWTSSQPHLVGLWSQRMAVVMAATLVPISLIWFTSESILLGLKQDPEVAYLAAIYLKWSVIGLPAYAFNSISRRYFQSQGLFAIPTRVILCVAPINALLNYALVWGPAPIRLGFVGAPIATAISFNLISIASIIYGVFFVPRTAWHPFSMRCFTSLGVLVQLGLAGVGQTASEWWSWELVGLAASLIGNLLGEENATRASYATKAALIIGVGIAFIWSAMFVLFRNSWAYIFNDDPEVVSLVASILPIVALFQVFDGQSAVSSGVLRAQGKQFTGALLNLSAYYIIGIPFGIWLAFKWHFGLHGLWVGLTLSLIYASTIGVMICLRTDWDREVQKVRKRLEADKLAHQDSDMNA
ncbi:hypothetical protein NLI96_g4836 [Meripilus lineatus]|uniref:MATE efflux family protein n=1 Tax=Meripilus lineatus TaxID=2056292 RepID=A0AAD5V634_9APHY|nr:hypothetical protein NLI96_g4836 [Physisporinus lineatus]